MAGVSPTQNSLKLLRKDGYTAQVVEYWNSFVGRRIDLFGGIDIVAVRPGQIMGIQTTSWTNVPARRRKLQELPGITSWLEAGGLIQIHGWKKLNNRWIVRVEALTAKV